MVVLKGSTVSQCCQNSHVQYRNPPLAAALYQIILSQSRLAAGPLLRFCAAGTFLR